MTILNRLSVPQIRHAERGQVPQIDYINYEQAKYHRYTYIRNYDDLDYWIIEFAQAYSFSHCLLDLIPVHILDLIQRGQITLLLCNYQHAYHNIVKDVYEYVISLYNIPPAQVLILSNSPDIFNEISYVSDQIGLPTCRAEFMSEFEAEGKYIAETMTTAKDTLSKKVYSKKFISFNGLPRPHRTVLLALLTKYDLLEQGYVSYNVRTTDSPSIDPAHWFWQLRGTDGFDKFADEYRDILLELHPIFLDTGPNYHHLHQLLHPAEVTAEHINMYKSTYFSIVTETGAYRGCSNDGLTGPGRLLSEKTFKTIVNQHVFLLIAVPNTLQLLRDLGYKTFSPWIDESYDRENNDLARSIMVAEQIKKLCALSGDQLNQFLDFAKPIVDHNYHTMMNKHRWCYPLC